MNQVIDFSEFWSRYGYCPIEQHCLTRAINRLVKPGEGGPWIAGGAVRRLITEQAMDTDIDYFFASADQFSDTRLYLEQKGAKLSRETELNLTYLLPKDGKEPELEVQLIKVAYFKTAGELINSFDFSLCQCAYDGKNLHLGKWTLWDLARKRLIPGKISYGVSSLRRIIKYTRQGYTVCSGGLAAMLDQIAKDPSIINHKIVSID